MRSALLSIGCLASVALGSALPPRTGLSSKRATVLQSDVISETASGTQQAYQESKTDQWEKCNSSNTVIRREWAEFSTSEKKEYIAAVQCLSRLPPKTPADVCPGCRNRYDDFVATHMQQSFMIHATGNFLAWHRYFTWAYEETLRNECGYTGHQPFYNWARWADDPASSPSLDGSDTSMSGNGVLGCTNQTFYGIPFNEQALIKIPHGTGGGCVESGPFKDWTVNLGPVFSDLTCVTPNPIGGDPTTTPNYGLGYNPRCLKRDISSWTSSQWSTDEEVVKLLQSPDIKTFWEDMQGGVPAFENNFMGVHTAGHFTIGGDPGGDFATSPGDPWFYFHHAMVDRTWWTWQNMKPEERTDALYGTIVISDPTAPATTLDDTMTLGYAYAKNFTIRELMSTMAGPLCYVYA